MNLNKYLQKGRLKTQQLLTWSLSLAPLNEIGETLSVFILTSLPSTLEKYLYNICLISLYNMTLVNCDHYRGAVKFFNNYRKPCNKPNCVSIQNIPISCITEELYSLYISTLYSLFSCRKSSFLFNTLLKKNIRNFNLTVTTLFLWLQNIIF